MICEMHTEHYLLPKRMVTDDHLLQVLPVTVNESTTMKDHADQTPIGAPCNNDDIILRKMESRHHPPPRPPLWH